MTSHATPAPVSTSPFRTQISTRPLDTGTGSAVLIAVSGELDLSNCGRLQAIADESASRRLPLLLDLSECPFIDSSGLRQILRISNALTDGAGPSVPMAVIAPAGSSAARVLELTGIGARLDALDSRHNAIAWLDARPNGTTTADSS
jgi:anti-anti-sigma factor